MAIKNSWASGEVLTAADLTDTMKGVYINAQTGTTYTFATADSFVSLSNASGGTATIPANATAAFNTGAVIGVMNAGTAGSFTIGTAAGVTLNAVSGTTVLAPLEKAELVKLGTNTWQLAKTSPTKVLQVVSADYTTQTTISSASLTDTGLTASITPSSASSKVLVLVTQHYTLYNSSVTYIYARYALLRGATVIADWPESPYIEQTASGYLQTQNVRAITFLDSPATTSAVTYKTQSARPAGTLVFQKSSYPAQMILMEIAA